MKRENHIPPLGHILLLLVLLAGWLPVQADEPARRFRVAFAQDNLANDWRAAQVAQLADAFAHYPFIEFIHSDAQGKTAKQIQDIEDFIHRGVDVLITSPMDAEAMMPVIRRAHTRGIPVVLLTRRITADAYTTYIGADDRQIAKAAARFLAERLGAKGHVLMLKGLPTATTTLDRTAAFREEIAGYPAIVITEKTANYLRADAIRAVEEVLGEGQRVDGIYAQSDSMAEGAIMALSKAGVDPASLPIVGIDYISSAREAIRRGEQAASFTYPNCTAEAVRVTLEILEGRQPPRRIAPASIRVTRDNVDAVEPAY